jgi:hypothetical protein
MDVESLAKQLILQNMTPEQQSAVLESVRATLQEARSNQKRRVSENVGVVVEALNKIESDIRARYDDLGQKITDRVNSIQDGRDGIDGSDGRDGKDGRPGRDGATGAMGPAGRDGRDGVDGQDGVSVIDAKIDFDGSLIIYLSNGRELNVGEVMSPDAVERIRILTYAGDNSGGGGGGTGLTYKGTWNASGNSPLLISSVGTSGDYYIVSTAGTTDLNGITDWGVGDWVIFNGTVWQKIDQSWATAGANSNITSMTGITGGISSPDFIQFDTAATNTNAVGKLYWDDTQKTLTVGLTADIAADVGQTLYAYATNAESVTINKGQPVYMYAAQGNRVSVKLAYNTGDATSAKTLGVCAENIAAGQAGMVLCQGVQDGLDLSAYTAGDTLYLGATAGALTATKPYAPNHLVYIGVVERANAGNGRLYVRVQNGYEMDELHNVSAQNPTNGQVLIYNESTSLWEKHTLTDGTGISITEGAGSITVTNSGVRTAQAGDGISVTGTNDITITNSGVRSITGTTNEIDVSASTGAVTLSLPATVSADITGNAATVTNGAYVNVVNTFSTNQIISTSSTSDALRITQTGSGNALLVEDSANPDSTPFVINNAGNVIRGYTATIASNLGTGALQSIGSDVSSSALTTLGLYSATGSRRAAIEFVKSATNTIDTQAQVVSGEALALIQASGSDGTAFIPAATIAAFVDGTPGTNDMPGRLVFSTTADGASTPTERMRISSTGQLTYTIADMTAANPSAFNVQTTAKAAQTGSTVGVLSTVSTDATYTGAGTVIGMYSTQGTLTVAPTNAYGFYVPSSWTGASGLNVAYYANIPAGTGRWNFYAGNTASNYFGGDVQIGVQDLGATTDTKTLTVASNGYAVVRVNGDYSNTSGEPGGSAIVFSSDGSTARQALVSFVNTGGTSGDSATAYTGTASNSMLVGTTGAQALQLGTNSTVAVTVDTSQNTTFAGGITVNDDVQTFNSSGTWTKPTFGNWVRIQMWGGGGGGSRNATATNPSAGGGGGYYETVLPIASMGATAAVTVGAAGVGRTASAGVGTAGGNSGVTLGSGSTIYVSGGLGGGVQSGGSGGYGAIVFSTTALPDRTTSPTGVGSIGSGGSPCNAPQDGYSYTGGGGGVVTGGTTGGKGAYGGGGGTRGTGAGGTSIFGGAGGNSAGAGVQPGGGGGCSTAANTNATDGGAGRVIITTF